MERTRLREGTMGRIQVQINIDKRVRSNHRIRLCDHRVKPLTRGKADKGPNQNMRPQFHAYLKLTLGNKGINPISSMTGSPLSFSDQMAAYGLIRLVKLYTPH